VNRSYLRLVALTISGSLATVLFTPTVSRYIHEEKTSSHQWFVALLAAGLIVAAGLGLRWVLQVLESGVDSVAALQAQFVSEQLDDRWVGTAIFASAALSLFLELAIIRWQAAIFPLFAFYKNLSLLACFAGLGIGYALASARRAVLFFTLPLLCWQFLLMIAMRYGLSSTQFQALYALPFREQMNMGISPAARAWDVLPSYFLMAVAFLLTALAFLPVGQLCGSLMERRPKLAGYGLNLLGSLGGVLLMFFVSAFWTPPTIWFLLSFAVLMCFYVRRSQVLLVGGVFAVLALIVLEWPVAPMFQRIYSPYQVLEVRRNSLGLMEIEAAGHYHQRVFDFADNANLPPYLQTIKAYYDLPYQVSPHPKHVLVVGAGTGNDVAAALRAGAEHVDAVEIDPAILMLGRSGHPEHPYSSPRVRAVVNDARSFLRNTNEQYDLIVFGLLDSHTLLSQASSVRLDSFVYTEQAFQEARSHLKPGGMVSLAFAVLSDQLGRKIYLMLKEAFGHAPLSIGVGYDGAVVFLVSPEEEISPPAVVSRAGFSVVSTYANPNLQADVSTDDWPFFYMPRRVYPSSYLVMIALILILTCIMIRRLLPGRVQPGNLPFLLLGAGFMLIETKSITELGLTFGNSWQVIGVVIAGIMVMAYLANLVVLRFDLTRTWLPYTLLLAVLAVGWWVAGVGGLPSNWIGRIGMVVLLTSPLFFSGIIFSTLLKNRSVISQVMAANLFGAMCGGLLEYNSMYFGFRFLYLMAAVLYVMAFVWELLAWKSPSLETAPASVRSAEL